MQPPIVASWPEWDAHLARLRCPSAEALIFRARIWYRMNWKRHQQKIG